MFRHLPILRCYHMLSISFYAEYLIHNALLVDHDRHRFGLLLLDIRLQGYSSGKSENPGYRDSIMCGAWRSSTECESHVATFSRLALLHLMHISSIASLHLPSHTPLQLLLCLAALPEHRAGANCWQLEWRGGLLPGAIHGAKFEPHSELSSSPEPSHRDTAVLTNLPVGKTGLQNSSISDCLMYIIKNTMLYHFLVLKPRCWGKYGQRRQVRFARPDFYIFPASKSRYSWHSVDLWHCRL